MVEEKTLLWSMVAESSQDSCRVKTSSVVRSLVREVKISNLGLVVFEKKNVAGSYISMDYRRLRLLVKVLQTPSCLDRDFHPRCPV